METIGVDCGFSFIPQEKSSPKLTALEDSLSKYEILHINSEGVSGFSRLVKQRTNGKLRIFKGIHKRIFSSDERNIIKDNIEVLKRLDHPSIVKTHEFY